MGATRRYASLVSLCLGTVFAAACGGGGGRIVRAAAGRAIRRHDDARHGAASLVLTIAIPSAGTSSLTRRVRYVSAGTKSATIVYGAQQQTVNCTTTCSATLQLSTGPAIDRGAALRPAERRRQSAGERCDDGDRRRGTAERRVDRVRRRPREARGLSLGAASATAGAAAQIPVTVKAIDAAGFTIVGPEPYASSLALSTDDHSGATSAFDDLAGVAERHRDLGVQRLVSGRGASTSSRR